MLVILDLKMGRMKGYFNQILMATLINIPMVSFGLTMGWVSGASAGRADGEDGGALIWAAAGTFLAALIGMPLCARMLQSGRKAAILATSAAFAVCWTLKLVSSSGWCLILARCAAGLGSSGAWTTAPLYVKEVASENMRGPLAATIILAQNLGYLLMFIFSDVLEQRTVLWVCLALTLCHCAVFAFVPESPAYLAANNQQEKARLVLSWLRGVPEKCPSLDLELKTIRPSQSADSTSLFHSAKVILRSKSRRKAVLICAVAVLGQEICGVFALLHYAEQVFALASFNNDYKDVSSTREPLMYTATIDTTSSYFTPTSTAMSLLPSGVSNYSVSSWNDTTRNLNYPVSINGFELTPSRQAILLGLVQLMASAVALYLVEKMGRKPLLVSSALLASAGMGVAGFWSWLGPSGFGASVGGGWVPAAALCVAIAADSAGLQPVPYVLMTEMFHYQYRGCVVTWVTAAACIANALELAVFPIITDYFGLYIALGAACITTLMYATFAIVAVPETKGKSPDEIYSLLNKREPEINEDRVENNDSNKSCTKLDIKSPSFNSDECYSIIEEKPVKVIANIHRCSTPNETAFSSL